MTLDVLVMSRLDEVARLAVNDRRFDERALDYINNLPVSRKQPYLRSAYVNYYFKAKQHCRETKESE